jgi:hypothetical protein
MRENKKKKYLTFDLLFNYGLGHNFEILFKLHDVITTYVMRSISKIS